MLTFGHLKVVVGQLYMLSKEAYQVGKVKQVVMLLS